MCPRPTRRKGSGGTPHHISIRDPLGCPEPNASSDFTVGSATLTTELSMNPSMDVGSTQRGSRPAGRTADGVSQGAFWKPTRPVLLALTCPTPAVRDCEVLALD